MRIVRFVALACVLLPATTSTFTGSSRDISASTYADRVRLFLSGSDSPVLFVGRVRDVYTGPLPCTVADVRQVKWDVTRVLYGFDFGKEAVVDFPSCGAVEAQFLSHSDMLVIARPLFRRWDGLKDSVVLADETSIGLATRAMDNYLRRTIRDVVKPPRFPRKRAVLAFEGTVVEAGRQASYPCASTVPPTFEIKFNVEAMLQGTLPERLATVHFPGCGPSTYPPFYKGQRMAVFVEIITSIPPPDILRGELVLPTTQSQQLRRALESADPPAQGENVPPFVPHQH